MRFAACREIDPLHFVPAIVVIAMIALGIRGREHPRAPVGQMRSVVAPRLTPRLVIPCCFKDAPPWRCNY
jgi:hypothetical protein